MDNYNQFNNYSENLIKTAQNIQQIRAINDYNESININTMPTELDNSIENIMM